MLDLMRRKAQSRFLQATVIIIILVFVFWGVGSNQGGGPNIVATVNDEPITQQEYDQSYNQTIDQYQQQFGGSIPSALLETLNIREQVLNKLIDRALIQQEAEKIGVHVSDLEVRDAITKISSFQVNGVFDVNTYQQLLSSSRTTVGDFEASVRIDLLGQKVLDFLKKFGRAANQDLAARFEHDNAKIKLQYVKFEAAPYEKDVTSTDENLLQYYEDNKAEFQLAQQRKLKYLAFLTKDLENQELTEEKLQEDYQKNIARFTTPEQRQARHILFKTTAEETAEEKAEKMKQAEEVLAMAKEGDDFAGLAMIYSGDGSASKGGDLGLFSRGKMVKPFEDAAFSMQEGEISDIVETQFGFHIIKLEKIKPSNVRPFEAVRGSIEARLKVSMGKELAKKMADEAYEKIILSGSLANYAEQAEKNIEVTDYFERQSASPGTLSNPAFLNAAFGLKKGELSSIITMPEGYAIIYVDDIKEPDVPPLQDIKDKVEKAFAMKKAKDIAKEKASEMLAAAKDGSDFKELAQKYSVDLQESAEFSRLQKFGTKLPGAVVDEGLNLTEQGPFPEEVISEGDATFVFRFFEKQPLEEALFEEKKEEYAKQLDDESTAALLTSWIDTLKNKAEIVIN